MTRTILLLEDGSDFSVPLVGTLKQHGFSLIRCSHGEEALKIIDSGTAVHLALIDIDPGSKCRGAETALLIQDKHSIPIVFLTSYPEKEAGEGRKKLTGYGYVRKNTDAFVLIESIEIAFRLFKAHNKVKESEAKYRAAFVTSPDSVNINRLEDGLYADVNEGFTALTGYAPEEVIGKSSAEIGIWARPVDRLKLLACLKRDGVVQNLEAEFRCKDGRLKTGLMSARIIRLEDEPYIISITRDISEKKEIEKELIMSEKRMRSLFDQAADGILIGSGSGIITDANFSIARITGYSREELIGNPIDIIFPPPELNDKPLRYDLVHKGEVVQRERIIRTRSGELVPVLMNTKKVDDDCLQAIIHDISGIRKAEKALKESEERFRLAVEGSRDGLWDWNLQTNDAYHSEQFAQMLGYEPDELPYTNNAWSDLIHPDDKEHAFKAVDDYLSGKTDSYETTFRMRTRDGNWRWINGRGKALFNEEGKAVRFVGFNTDITRLRELIDEKEYLLREINHRVKNNLAMITSLISIKQMALGDKVDLSDLTNQIHAIRIVHEKLYESDDASIGFREYSRGLLNEIFSAASIGDVLIDIDVPPISLPVKTVIPLGLILNELATNAVKHGFNTLSRHRLSLRMSCDQGSGTCSLTIANSGNSFEGKLEDHTPGSVGLQLVRTLVNQIQGSISLEKEPETAFTIRFPV